MTHPSSHTTFAALPANSRIWAFVADHDLSAEEVAQITESAEKFLRIWKTKAELIKGCWELRENRFLIVGADESESPLSGCSVDAMMARLMKLERETGLKLIDRTAVYYRGADGKVHVAPRPQFRKLLEAGQVEENTLVFDTTISRVESLRENRFEVPMKDCWHAELFLQKSPAGG